LDEAGPEFEISFLLVVCNKITLERVCVGVSG